MRGTWGLGCCAREGGCKPPPLGPRKERPSARPQEGKTRLRTPPPNSRGAGSPRAALVLRDSLRDLEPWDPFSRRRLVGASFSIVIWGALLGLAAIVFDWHLPFLRSLFSVPVISLAG